MELVQKAKLNKEAYGELYLRYPKQIYNYCFYKTFNKAISEDIVSEVFLRAMDGIQNFQGGDNKFLAYLYTIAKNTLINSAIKENRQVNFDENEHSYVEDQSFDKTEIMQAINKLSDNEKELIILKYVNELTINEICKVTSKTEDSVKSYLKRAKDNLEIILNGK